MGKRIFATLLVCALVAGLAPVRARAYDMGKAGEYQTISAGEEHSLAIKNDGTLWAWGSNHYGEVGTGDIKLYDTPVKVMDDVEAVSAGDDYSLAIKNDGTLWAWGNNDYGQLGDGTTEDRHTPVKIMGDVEAVSAGYNYSLAIRTDGTLWAWGDNFYGKLGDGTYEDHYTPVKVLDNVKAVSAGNHHTLAIKTDGTLWAWGYSGYGLLGDGTTEFGLNAVKIMDNMVAVSAHDDRTFALQADGTLWAWGDNSFGMLGDGTTEDRRTPVKIMDGVTAVNAGYHCTLAIKTDGTLWAWGTNGNGTVGNGTTDTVYTPVEITDDVVATSAGDFHALAIKTDGTLWAWGYRDLCGLGWSPFDENNQLTPIKVMDNIRCPDTEPLPPQDTPSTAPSQTEDDNATSSGETEVTKPDSKVETVSLERVYDRARVVEGGVDYGVTDCEYAVITGLDGSGDEVWRYTTDKYVETECHRTGEIGINRGMYLFCDGGTITALDLQSGAVRWQNSDYGGVDGAYLMDNGVLYACGQYGPDFFAIDMAGNTLARVQRLDKEYYWAEKIQRVDKHILVVEFAESEGSYHDAYCVYIDCRDYSYSRALADTTQVPQDTPTTDKTDPQPDSGTDLSDASSLLSDFDQVSHKEAVTALVELGIIKGLPDGRYAPRDHIDRSSWAKLLAEPLNPHFGPDDWPYYQEAYTELKDIENNWAESYIKYLYFRDVICGDNFGNYRPIDDITVVEAAKTILVAIGLDADSRGYTNDPLWAENIMADAKDYGLMTGLNVYTFDSLTRDDAAQMIYNALDELGL